MAEHSIGEKYFSYRDPVAGNALGCKAEQLLRQIEYDVLLTNDYCIAGYTRADKPIILYTDAIFPHRYAENVHPWLDNLSAISVYFCQRTVRRGLSKSTRCFFASEYVMREAKKYAAPDAGDYHVIPYGANIDAPSSFSPRTVEAIRKKGSLDLLFVGKDWEQKGGEIAVKTVQLLNERELSTCLPACGGG